MLNGEELWELVEGLGANHLLQYSHLLTGRQGLTIAYRGTDVSMEMHAAGPF